MKFIQWGIILAVGLTGCGLTADSVCGFNEASTGWTLHEQERRQQSITVENYNFTYGNIAIIKFTPEKHGYFELLLQKPYQLAENETLFKGTISLEVCTQTPEAVRKISIRLIDSKGEIFQLMQPVQLRRGEWTTISFTLDKSAKFGPVWGGNKDRKIDYPVSMSALTVDFDRQFPSSSNIMLSNIAWIHQ